MADEEVTPQVEEQAGEAAEAHEEAPATEGTPWSGEGNQPEGTGYAPPDTGAGDDASSEIPTGVEEIEPAEGSAGDDGGSEPVDLANLDTGDEAPAGEAADVSDAAEADAEPPDAGAADVSEAEAEAPAAEADAEAGEAEAEAAEPEAEAAEAPAAEVEAPAAEAEEEAPAAEVEAPAAEAEEEAPAAEAEAPAAEEAEAPAAEAEAPAAEEPAEPAAEADDEEEPVGDPDKFSAGGEVSVAGQGPQSGLEPGEAEKAGEVPTEFRVPPGVPAGLDPGTPADRDKPV